MTNRDELRADKALQGVEFPVSKATLVRYAEDRGASPKTLRALQALPEGHYANKDEVEQAVPQRPEQQ